MDIYDRCTGCHRGCYLSNPGCHVGRNMARYLMYGEDSGYMRNDERDWDPYDRGSRDWDSREWNRWDRDHPNWDAPDYDRGMPPYQDYRPYDFEHPQHEAHEWFGPRARQHMRQMPFNDRPDPRRPQGSPAPFDSGRPHAGDRGRGHAHGMRRGPMGAPDDEFLIHSFQHCAHLLVHRQSKEHASSRAVMVLQRRGQDGMSQRELAESLDIRSASVSELLSKMKDEGLITRRPDPEDKRVMLIELTDKGHDEARKVAERRKEANRNLFAVLNDEEKDQLAVILDKLTHFWHEEFAREEHR